jgi:hypothetical protein
MPYTCITASLRGTLAHIHQRRNGVRGTTEQQCNARQLHVQSCPRHVKEWKRNKSNLVDGRVVHGLPTHATTNITRFRFLCGTVAGS